MHHFASKVKKGPSWYITHIMLLPPTTLFDSVVAGNRSYTIVSKIGRDPSIGHSSLVE